jgi:hypothetical protein
MAKGDGYSQGYYNLINKSKYMGKTKPFYRSSYEARVFSSMDRCVNVLEWCTECETIPYVYEIDGKIHRYYPDIIAKVKTKSGKIKTIIAEIKPYRQTKEPDKPKNKNKKRQKRFVYETMRWIKNKNKWDATREYCKKHGYEFQLLTEKEIWKERYK